MLQQQHPVPGCEASRIRNAGLKTTQNLLDEPAFTAKTGDQRDIGILGKSRLAPTLYSNTADEAHPPLLKLTKRLKIACRVEDIVGDPVGSRHPCSFLNQRCCSTKPEWLIRFGFL